MTIIRPTASKVLPIPVVLSSLWTIVSLQPPAPDAMTLWASIVGFWLLMTVVVVWVLGTSVEMSDDGMLVQKQFRFTGRSFRVQEITHIGEGQIFQGVPKSIGGGKCVRISYLKNGKADLLTLGDNVYSSESIRTLLEKIGKLNPNIDRT